MFNAETATDTLVTPVLANNAGKRAKVTYHSRNLCHIHDHVARGAETPWNEIYCTAHRVNDGRHAHIDITISLITFCDEMDSDAVENIVDKVFDVMTDA